MAEQQIKMDQTDLEQPDPVEEIVQEVTAAMGEKPRVRKYRPRSFEVDREEVVDTVLDELTSAEDDRDEWMTNHARWLAKYLGVIERSDEGPNLHIPLIMTHVQRMCAGLVGAIMSGGKVVRAKSRNRSRLQNEEHISDFLNYQLLEELEFEEIVEQLALDFLVHGKFIAKIPFTVKKETVQDIRRFPPGVTNEDVLMELYPADVLTKDKDEYTVEVTRTAIGAENDRQVKDLVEFYPDATKTEVVITHEDVVWENPQVIRKRLEDVVVPNPDSLRSILKAPWVIDKSWITLDEIRRNQKDGLYDLMTDKDLEKLDGWEEEETGGNQPEEDSLKTVSASQQGVSAQRDETGTRTGCTLLECYWSWDVDGDGLNEKVVFWVLRELKILVRARYLSEVYRDHEWPFAEAGFIGTDGFYSMGIPEFAEGIQDAVVVLHNQGLEWGEITNTPLGFYRPSSGMKPEKIKYEPGTLLPLDNPQQDVYFPPWPNANQSWRFNEEGLLNQYLERGLAQGPVQFGQAPEGKASALRTARSTLALIGQGDLQADLTLKRFYRGIRRIFKLVWRRDKEFLPPGKTFRIVGAIDPTQDPFSVIQSREELQGDFDFELVGTNFTASKDAVRQVMLLVFQTLLNPLALQTGIVNPANIYEMCKELLLSLERRDYDRFINKPLMGSFTPPKDPLVEHEDMMRGVPARVSPQENLQEHWQAHMAFIQSDAFGMVPPEYVPLFRSHLEETQQALAMFNMVGPEQAAAARATQAQVAGNPAVANALEAGLGAHVQAAPEMPVPGALGPGGRYGSGGDSRNPKSRTRS